MTTTETAARTMTEAQMAWNFKNGFAWFGQEANGTLLDHHRDPVWTKAGPWWNDEPGTWTLDNSRPV